MWCLWVWLSPGVAHHGVAYPWDAVPVSTLTCPGGLVLANLRVVRLLSGRFLCSILVSTWLC